MLFSLYISMQCSLIPLHVCCFECLRLKESSLSSSYSESSVNFIYLPASTFSELLYD